MELANGTLEDRAALSAVSNQMVSMALNRDVVPLVRRTINEEGTKEREGRKMRVILFQPRFAKIVKEGTKRQTIRREARCKAGDKLSLRQWAGKPRRKGSRQVVLGEATCTSVTPVRMAVIGITIMGIFHPSPDYLAHADGFENFAEMLSWFGERYGLPFEGWLIRWGERGRGQRTQRRVITW